MLDLGPSRIHGQAVSGVLLDALEWRRELIEQRHSLLDVQMAILCHLFVTSNVCFMSPVTLTCLVYKLYCNVSTYVCGNAAAGHQWHLSGVARRQSEDSCPRSEPGPRKLLGLSHPTRPWKHLKTHTHRHTQAQAHTHTHTHRHISTHLQVRLQGEIGGQSL